MSEPTARVPRPRDAEDQVAPITHEHVVVGVDGSEASVNALAWALHYAAENDATVEVITAWPVHSPTFVGEVPGHFSEERWKASEAQARAVAHAVSLVDKAPPYTRRLENARVVDSLVKASRIAGLLVVGSDRLEPYDETVDLRHRVPLTVHLQGKAWCPVILVPFAPEHSGEPGGSVADAVAERGRPHRIAVDA